MKFLLKFPQYLDQKFAAVVVFLVRGYQKTISPDHSEVGKGDHLRTCKFYPTCSEYAIQILRKRGFVCSIGKIFWRILRCNPWGKGGVDFPDKTRTVSKK